MRRERRIGLDLRLRKDHTLGKEDGSIAVMLKDIAHRRGRNMRVLLKGRDDKGLNFRRKPVVHIRNGPLVLEIKHVPHAPDDMMDTFLAASVDGKIIILDDFHPTEALGRLTDDVNALVHSEKASLVLIYTHSHDHLVKHGEGAAEDVQMACGEGVERARE